MKSWIIGATLGAALLFGCAKQSSPEVATTLVKTPTIVCGSCEKNIKNALGKVAGVQEVQVDTKAKTVQVRYESAKTSVEQIETAITGAGYNANERKRDQAAYEKLDACCKSDG